MANVDQISEQVFKIIKGYGQNVILFTENGKTTTNPNEAYRFYLKDSGVMVNLIMDNNTSEIVVNVSDDRDIEPLLPMLTALRNFANQNIIEYTLKTFGKTIEPKDFSHQAKHVTTEGFIDSFKQGMADSDAEYQAKQDAKAQAGKDREKLSKQKAEVKAAVIGGFDEMKAYVGTDLSKTRNGAREATKKFPALKKLNKVEDRMMIYYKKVADGKMTAKQAKENLFKAVMGYKVEESMDKQSRKVDESLPPHLQKHFDKDGDKIHGSWKGGKWTADKKQPKKAKDVTPKGYGPDEVTEGTGDREIPLSHYPKYDNVFFRVLHNGKDAAGRYDDYESARTGAAKYRGRMKRDGYDPKGVTIHAYVKESHDLNEGFSGWHGSARKSVNELANAKLVVKHRRSVDEEKRGARTRQIESIFIENTEGERFKFPSNNVTAAKAMVRHVNEGGTPFDEFGQYIYETMEELNQLKSFSKKNRNGQFFENATVDEEITGRITSLRQTLTQMAGPKGYAAQMEAFGNGSVGGVKKQIDEIADDAIMSKYFDESVSSSMPYVARLIGEMKQRQVREAAVCDLAKKVLSYENDFEIVTKIDEADLDNPDNLEHGSDKETITSWIGYLTPKMVDKEMAESLTKVGETVDQLDARHRKMVETAIRAIVQRSAMTETSDIGEEKVATDLAEMADLDKLFAKYDVRKIFSK